MEESKGNNTLRAAETFSEEDIMYATRTQLTWTSFTLNTVERNHIILKGE